MEHRYYQDRPPPAVPHHNGNTSEPVAHVEAAPRTELHSLEKKRETRRRTKTGCATCRKRRIKCDEGKPECLRCLKSKRPCEGYNTKTVFKNENALHYQQSIRPSPQFPTSNPTYAEHQQAVHFVNSSYRNGGPGMYENGHNFVVPHPANAHLMQSASKGEPNSRNSSASNASGVSANSEQRRISVLSLMSSDKDANSSVSGARFASDDDNRYTPMPIRTPETDARDNYYYNYYISHHAYILSRRIPQEFNADVAERDDSVAVWLQLVPSLINDDPPGRRPLFDAIVAYTAHIRFEMIPIDYEVRSVGEDPRLLELALKVFIDIIRGTTFTLAAAELFFTSGNPLCVMLRWGILQHTIVHILADTNPRVAWIHFMNAKASASSAFEPRTDLGKFYLLALRHISTGSLHNMQLPPKLIELYAEGDFAAVPGIDIVHAALTHDYDVLKNRAYHALTVPRLENLYMVYQMLNGARMRGQPSLEPILDDLTAAMRQC